MFPYALCTFVYSRDYDCVELYRINNYDVPCAIRILGNLQILPLSTQALSGGNVSITCLILKISSALKLVDRLMEKSKTIVLRSGVLTGILIA